MFMEQWTLNETYAYVHKESKCTQKVNSEEKFLGMLCSYTHIINVTLNITQKLFCLLCLFLFSWKASNFQYAPHTKKDCEIVSFKKVSIESLLPNLPLHP